MKVRTFNNQHGIILGPILFIAALVNVVFRPRQNGADDAPRVV
jgi:hypothetical protein